MNPSAQYQTVEVNCCGQALRIRYIDTGQGDVFLFLHGWGTGAYTFFPVMEILSAEARVIAFDFPGFGESTLPQDVWGTPEYAELVFELAKTLAIPPCYLISHSFGGRVAMRMALKKPEWIQGMVLLASAGIKRPQPFLKKIKIKFIQYTAKTAAGWLPGGPGRAVKHKLYSWIASPDYQQAGALKNIFVRVVNEDMKDLLPRIQTPALLLYGSDDEMTPPFIGQKLADGLPRSRYIELQGFDHHTLLDRGRHQVCHHIRIWKNDHRQEGSA